MNQKEYRSKKAKEKRLAESLATTPLVGKPALTLTNKGVTELMRDPGQTFVDPDNQLDPRINAPMWGSGGQQGRVQKESNPTNLYYGIPETNPEDNEDND